MARTQQTARKSTGGKAPRRAVFPSSPANNNALVNLNPAIITPLNVAATTPSSFSSPRSTMMQTLHKNTLTPSKNKKNKKKRKAKDADISNSDDESNSPAESTSTQTSNNSIEQVSDSANEDDGDETMGTEDVDTEGGNDGDEDESDAKKKAKGKKKVSKPRKKAKLDLPEREHHSRNAKKKADEALRSKFYSETFDIKEAMKEFGGYVKEIKRKTKSEDSGSDYESEDKPKPKKQRAKREKKATTKKAATTKKKRASPCTFTPSPELIEKLDAMTDETFSSNSSEIVTNCSPIVSSREAIRAVLTKNYELLQKVVNDFDHVNNYQITRSVDVKVNALDLAIRSNDLEAAKIIMKGPTETHNTKPRVSVSSNLSAHSTGHYSRATFGRAIRAIHSARGSKEGISALTKDDSMYLAYDSRGHSEVAISALKYPITKDTFNYLLTSEASGRYSLADQGMYQVVESGNLDVALYVAEAVLEYGSGLNNVHIEALKLRNDDESFSKFQTRSVTKKAGTNAITPVHFAAINPNVKFLTELTSHVGIHISDKNNRKPIHFAAACVEPTTVKFLMEKGAAPDEADKSKRIPLHYAAKAGRAKNIEYLLPEDQPHLATLKDSFGYTPLHLAAFYGNYEFVKGLLDRGVDPNILDTRKETPLFSAAKSGHLDVVKILIEKGASVGKQDKHKRCALILSVMNGHYDITKYLIQQGSSPNATDSSGNSVVHYACAYGWLNILKLLHASGAEVHVFNDWKKTPLAVAFLKGFISCCDYLLKDESVDVNVQDEEGQTMLHSSFLNRKDDTLKLAKFLIEEKGARCDISDLEGTSLFHLLAGGNSSNDEELANLLLKHNSPMDLANKTGQRPIDIALTSGNKTLFRILLENNAKITFEDKKSNMLHSIMTKTKEAPQLFEILENALHDRGEKQKLIDMAKCVDGRGRTPLHVLFDTANPPTIKTGSSYLDNEIDSDEEQEESSEMNDKEGENGTNHVTSTMEEEDGEKEIDLESNEDDMEDDDEMEDEELHDQDFIVGGYNATQTNADQTIDNNVTLFIDFVNCYLKHTKADINTPVVEVKKETDEEKKKKQKDVTSSNDDEEDVSDESDDDSEDDNDFSYHYGHHQSQESKQTDIGYTLLHKIVNKSHASLLEFLVLKLKANVNARDMLQRTPLHFAMHSAASSDQDAYGICKFLLKNGADMTALDSHHRTPIFYLFVDMVKAQAPQQNNYGYSFGFYSQPKQTSLSSSSEPIEILSNFSNNEGFSATHKDNTGKTMLHYSAKKGYTISSMFLIQLGCGINDKDNIGNTPLAYAMLGNHIDFAVNLINKGAHFDIDIYSERKVTVASSEKKIIGKKSTSSSQQKKTEIVSHSLFKQALQLKALGLAFLLISRGVEATKAINDSLETRMYQMAADLISKVPQKDLEKKDSKTGESLLHVVSQFSAGGYNEYCRKIIKLLANRGLSLDDIDSKGRTPLHNSVEKNSIITRFLLKHGADVSIQEKENKSTPLHLACHENRTDIVDLILNSSKFEKALNSKDKFGKTPLHYAVSFSEFGSFENDTLVQALIQKGAKYSIKDEKNRSPLFYALVQQSGTFASLFKKLGADIPKSLRTEAKREFEKYSEQFFAVSQFEKLDVKKDAEEARAALESQQTEVKLKPTVHRSMRKQNMKVLEDEDGRPYDILLNKVDVKHGEYGINLFYKQQVVYNQVQDLYIFFTNWGRVGEPGQHQQTPLPKDEAIIEFKKNFRSKTGNLWDERDDFHLVAGKYSIVELTATKIKENLKPIDLSKSPNSKLDSRIQNLMSLLCDTTIMRKNLQFYGIDTTLARLHKKHLIAALSLLNKVQEQLVQFEKEDISPTDKKEVMDNIFKLSSEFYQLLPHKQFRESVIPALTTSDVASKRKMLEDLIDLQITSRIILASTTKARVMNPLDYVYNAIRTHMKPISANDEDYGILKRYINKVKSYEILNMFRVSRQEEQDRFKPHLNKKRMLLFHGSSVTNFISILSQGLRIAPPEAPASGYMFGKGIYSADLVEKSIGYCQQSLSGNVVCLLLCEVAIGKTFDYIDNSSGHIDKLVPGYDSTKGMGIQGPDFSENFTTFDGMIIPVGKLISYPAPEHKKHSYFRYPLSYNEYIVYDESQVRIRYLVQLKL